MKRWWFVLFGIFAAGTFAAVRRFQTASLRDMEDAPLAPPANFPMLATAPPAAPSPRETESSPPPASSLLLEPSPAPVDAVPPRVWTMPQFTRLQAIVAASLALVLLAGAIGYAKLRSHSAAAHTTAYVLQTSEYWHAVRAGKEPSDLLHIRNDLQSPGTLAGRVALVSGFGKFAGTVPPIHMFSKLVPASAESR